MLVWFLKGKLLPANLLLNVGEEPGDFLRPLLPELNGTQQILLCNLVRTRLNHHDAVEGGCQEHIEIRLLAHFARRIEHKFTSNHADTHGPQRPVCGTVGKCHCQIGRIRGNNVVLMLKIVGKHCAEHLNVVPYMLGEHRTKSAVNNTRHEHELIGRPALALTEAAAGNSATGVVLLLVHNLQREEIHAFTRFCRDSAVAHTDGVTHLAERSCIRLVSEQTRPHGYFLITEIKREFFLWLKCFRHGKKGESRYIAPSSGDYVPHIDGFTCETRVRTSNVNPESKVNRQRKGTADSVSAPECKKKYSYAIFQPFG